MTRAQELLSELKLEAAVTRNYLQKVPFNRLDYKPNEKSETLGRLAVHVAEIIAWWKDVLTTNALDFINFKPKEFETNTQLLAYFDELLLEATNVLTEAKDEDFEKEWQMKHGDTIYFTLSKKQSLRLFCMNHLVHHRAQLGVYLRLLNIAIPATYGPSADDENILLIDKF